MTPYHEALAKNRDEIVALNKSLTIMITRREVEIQTANTEISLLKKSISVGAEMITQIDLELNRKTVAA